MGEDQILGQVKRAQEKARQIGELALHQEFSVWQNIFRAWQQVTGVGIFDCVLCIISVFGMMEK